MHSMCYISLCVCVCLLVNNSHLKCLLMLKMYHFQSDWHISANILLLVGSLLPVLAKAACIHAIDMAVPRNSNYTYWLIIQVEKIISMK